MTVVVFSMLPDIAKQTSPSQYRLTGGVYGRR